MRAGGVQAGGVQGNRGLAFGLALLPFVIAVLLFLTRGTGEALFPGLDPAEIGAIDMERAGHGVRLVRAGEAWVIDSAAGAPADPKRVDALVDRLRRLRLGRPAAPAPDIEPVRLLLHDRNGNRLGAAAFRPGAAAVLGADGALGPWRVPDRMPALPLWPSAWTSLVAPAIPVASVATAVELTAGGARPLDPARREQIAVALGRLSARGFVAASSIDWAGARLLRVGLRDGSTVDLQTVPDGRGGAWVRLTSDTRADIRAARRYAFRSVHPLVD